MTADARSSRRSEQIRERRGRRSSRSALPFDLSNRTIPKGSSRRSKKSTAARRYQARVDHAIPPVMVRGGTSGMPVVERKRGKTRRRYDVPLPVAGAEMRLPALPQVRIGWRLISALLVGLLGFLVYQAWNSPRLQVEAPEIGGLQRLTQAQVAMTLDLTGQPVFMVNPKQVEETLRSEFPEFSAVSVAVSLPNTVAISVTERLPVLNWRQNGRIQLVDEQGYAFPVRQEGEMAAGPLVEAASPPPLLPGEAAALFETPAPELSLTKPIQPEAISSQARPFLDPEMVQAILTMAKQAPKDTALIYDAAHGLGWKDGRGWDVYFGDMKDMEMKLSVYKSIVKQLQADDETPLMISVEYVHAPYYRLKP